VSILQDSQRADQGNRLEMDGEEGVKLIIGGSDVKCTRCGYMLSVDNENEHGDLPYVFKADCPQCGLQLTVETHVELTYTCHET